MRNACSPFEGKKVTLLGLGVLGRGVGDAAFLAKCGARVVVTDKKSVDELAASVEKLKKYPNIEFHLGGHRKEDFTDADLIIKAAGVPLDSSEITLAREKNIPVAMSTALFAKYAMEEGAQIVGVTGTRGKSTVSTMIYHSAVRAGKRARLGGNIRGLSTLAMLPEIKSGDICVLELDSWQLQGFGDLEISPHITVFTNLMPDHMNYYGDDMEKYFSDKANIFRYQRQGDTLIVGKQIFGKVDAARPEAAPHVPPAIPSDWQLKIVGEHNRDNAALAAAALRALNLSEKEIRNGIESFEAVEGRLQFVREIRGVKIYNDNNATTPDATIAALEALDVGHSMSHIVLIAGGSEKDLPLEKLIAAIKDHCLHVILLTHDNYQGSARLANGLEKADVAFEKATSLQQALDGAIKETKQGTILFSPAFASFGMFGNEYERNDEFLSLVRGL